MMQDDDISDLTSMVSSGDASLPEARVPTTRLHPSRTRQDGDLDDALEYYAPKTKKISGDNADDVGGLNDGVVRSNAIAGAFRVPPSPLTDKHGQGSSENLNSLYHIPNASLVDQSSDHTNSPRPILLSQEPELVFASPLDSGMLQQQPPKTTASFNESTEMNNKPRKLIFGEYTGVKRAKSGAIVVSKRVLYLILVVSCLAVMGLVSGVAYYVVANKQSNDSATDSTSSRSRPPKGATPATISTDTTNAGGGGKGGSNEGNGRRSLLRTR